MGNKQVTVVMSSYNHGKYVGKAIESVLNQTFREIYFVVADDASTDNTVDVLMQYENEIDEIHLYDLNSGHGRWKPLIMNAQTKYIAIINSDDYWEKTKLEKQMAYMEKHPECAACFTWCNEVTEEGKPLENQVFQVGNRTKEEWMYRFWEGGNCLAHPSILIRREIYQELFCKNNSVFRQLPDLNMWMRLVQNHEIHIIEEKLVTFLHHKSNVSQNVSEPNAGNLARDYIETGYIWYRTMKEMTADYFKKAFGKIMINPAAKSVEEILCEKFFAMYRSPIAGIQSAAVNFYYDVFWDDNVYQVLKHKYGYYNKDFHKADIEIGFAKELKESSMLREKMGQLVENTKRLLALSGEGIGKK